ncbi:MAG: DUF484 family protein [Burkholderiales bacterium]|nr:DUF484 family protein [Burkholderiales bacterium]
MNPEDVARYLQDNPIFFERYADLLSQIHVPHPHGDHAIPLSDRQVISLREKNRALEAKLSELIQFGEENDAISEKVHRLGMAMLSAADLAAVFACLEFNLREDFAVPHVALRVWRGSADLPEFAPVSEEVRGFARALEQPFCGPNTGFEAVAWLRDAAEHIRSVAFMPVRDRDEVIGLLMLASEDAQRFYPEMGTLYLKRIGELVGAALLRFV